MTKVKNVMTTNVISVSKNASMMNVAEVMADNDISCVTVVENKKPIGIISERDMIKRFIVKNKCDIKLNASEIMTPNPRAISQNTNILMVADLMKKNKYRRFPIVENGELVGIITETDVMYFTLEIIRRQMFIQTAVFLVIGVTLLIFAIVFR